MSKRKPTIRKNTRQIVRGYVAMRAFSSGLPKSPPARLYRIVYGSAVSVLVSVVLLTSFLLQGVYVVYANEASSDTLISIPIEVSASPDATEVAPETNALPEEDVVVDVLETIPTPQEFVAETETDISIVSEEQIADGSETGNAVESEEVTNEENGGDLMTGYTDTGAGDDSQESVGGANDTEPSVDEATVNTDGESGLEQSSTTDSFVVATISATSSDELIGPVTTEPVGETFTDTGYMFSKNECTELASGSFYCLEPKENLLADALFAAPDADGDLEIFLVRNGEQVQVTDNFVDDAAPFFDNNSNSLVWHRLVNDRYQIIAYDVSTGDETQLTSGTGNNMEPIRQGDYTVWQRWVDNNWEIILYDGVSEEQISHVAAHDIAPYIHGSLVVWNRYSLSGEKTIEMYDISSRTYVTVDDPDGMSVTNPRMVLVYDQMHPNGDIVTKGYDMIERRFIQLDTLPRDIPDEIPHSEPTSETRALIQSKPVVKGDEVKVTGLEGGNDPQEPSPAVLLGTDEFTLDLTIGQLPPDVAFESATSSEFDLIIQPLATSTEANEQPS